MSSRWPPRWVAVVLAVLAAGALVVGVIASSGGHRRVLPAGAAPIAGTATYSGFSVQATCLFHSPDLVLLSFHLSRHVPPLLQETDVVSLAPVLPNGRDGDPVPLVSPSGDMVDPIDVGRQMDEQNRFGDQLMAFYAPSPFDANETSYTLEVPTIIRYYAVDTPNWLGDAPTLGKPVSGVWTLHLTIPAANRSTRLLPSPAPGQLLSKPVSFHDFRYNGDYLIGTVDAPDLISPKSHVGPYRSSGRGVVMGLIDSRGQAVSPLFGYLSPGGETVAWRIAGHANLPAVKSSYRLEVCPDYLLGLNTSAVLARQIDLS